MGKNCAIPGCPNEKYNGKYLKGFGFPQDEELRKRWIEIIQMNCPGWVPTKYPRFCTLHFDQADIMDGKNNKLQYQAVPVYFTDDLKKRELPKKEKISTLIRQMNQNQILYSSDSEAEYQIVVKVHKKPRKKNISGHRIRCVYCSMKKDTATELQAHVGSVHGIEVDLISPADVLEYGTKGYIDGNRNFMCTECGLIFSEAPLDAINHVQSHLDQTQIVYEEMPMEEHTVEEEYIIDETEDIKQELVTPKEEYIMPEDHQVEIEDTKEIEIEMYQEEEPLIEENVRTTFKCKLCNIDYATIEEIKAHINKMHNQPRPSTVVSTFKPKPMAQGGSDEEPETYEPQCYLCDSLFTSLAKMRKHIRANHDTEEYYYCSHCTGTFTSLDMYEDHECLEEVLQ